MNVDLTQGQANLLLQSVDNTVKSGRLDDSIRLGGVGAVIELAALAQSLRSVAESDEDEKPVK